MSSDKISGMKPPRIPWGNFADVLIHASESSVKQHPHYWAAKTGDALAADYLVNDTLNPAKTQALAVLLAGHKPVLVSAHAYEQNGVNAIPEVFADELAELLNWEVDGGVVQVNVVAHTGADGFSRLARQAQFDGKIEPGTEYVMVDDFIGMGGTLANLRGHMKHRVARCLLPWH